MIWFVPLDSIDHHGSGMNVKSYDLCLVVDLDGVGQAGYGGLFGGLY